MALNQYLGELKEKGFIEEGDKDITVWISGYSRGAATTNLLAAKLSSTYLEEGILEAYGETEDHVKDIVSTNVFAFCFECPQNTTAENSSLQFGNIINIINPKDFVTYVAMNNGWDWKFRRYGRDFMLPDEANTNGADYAQYYQSMAAQYQADSIPEIGASQSVNSRNFATAIANMFGKKTFPIIYEEGVQKIASDAMAEGKTMDTIIWENLEELYFVCILKFGAAGGLLANLGVEFGVIKDGIAPAHYPELCMAWMDSISEDVLTKQKSFWNVIVNCPVDIYVYEGENLVGCIKNDVPQKIENGVITMLDSNGQKKIVLPGDSEYKLVYKATGDGTMTISTSKYVQAEAQPETVTSYYELPLEKGSTYESVTTVADFELLNAAGEKIEASVKQSGDEVRFYRVDLSVEGNGEAEGIGTYSIGEYAKVSASPAEGEQFLGWYEGEKLVSTQAEYRFCVKKDTVLKAKFTNLIAESEKEQQKADDPSKNPGETQSNIKVGNCYTIKKHKYKITSVKKKTVAFVKTKSKAKTITIPSTVKIKGKKYKVTCVAANALKGNKKVTKITIGSNVTSIGKTTFANCTSLKSITIPSNVKTIGESAFSGCNKLTKVTIGKGVTKIGKKAFYNCKKLKTITIKSKKIKKIGKYAFKGIATKAKIKCPAKQYKKYKKMIVKTKIGSKVKIKK